jgi:tetratricopeptide (TPR) repeat protein
VRKSPAKPAPAGSGTGRKAPTHKGQTPTSLVELNRRLVTARAAQDSGNLNSVVQANGKLLALALRELGDLRLLEEAFPEAAELYRRSLDFEDFISAHEGLAVAYISLKQPTAAISEADRAIAADPNRARAWNLKGKAAMLTKDYKSASQALARSLALKGDMETAYSLAMCQLALKDKARAQMVFRDMIAASGGDRASLHILFGRAYRDANMREDAIREFRRALELDPKVPHAHYFIGLMALMLNEWAPLPEIRQEMQAELKYHPRDYLANYVMGVFTSNDKDYDRSNGYLTIATEEQPRSPEPWIYLGLNESSRGNAKLAETYLRKAIELTGTDESRSHYQIRKAYVALGRILIQSGRKEEAAQWMAKARAVQALGLQESQQTIAAVFSDAGVGMGAVMPYISPEEEERSIAASPVDATAQINAAQFTKAKLNPKETEAALQQEKALREILATAYNDLGTAEARQKDYVHARDHFAQAEKWNPDIPGLTRNLGLAAAKIDDHPTAVHALSKQLQAQPDDQVARALLGISLFMTEKFADAANTIAPLGDLAARDPALAYPWAASLARIGKLKEAAAVAERAEREQLAPEHLLLLAQLWTDLGDTDHAVRDYQRALEVDPKLRFAHYKAGLAWLRGGKPAEAQKEFEAELAMYPDDPNTLYNLGFAHQQQGDDEGAKKMFESALARNPNHANAQYQLGKMLLDAGQVKPAIEHLEAAARLSPDIDYIHYQLQVAYRKDDRMADAERELQLYKDVKAKNRDKQLPQPTPDMVQRP